MRWWFAVLAFLVPVQGSAEPSPAGRFQPDPSLQDSLRRVVADLGFTTQLRQRRLAISLLDLSDPRRPRYAGLNDRKMMYAASLPKIAILLAGFEKVNQGLMPYTALEKRMFTRMIRKSRNRAASRAVQAIGFRFIAETLMADKYRFYDPKENGGLWVGKAYGGQRDRWRRDPLNNLSHGANSYQVARFFWLLKREELVSPRYSIEMKEILSKPAIPHKFVKGLASRPDRRIYRKSGTWRKWHCDAALVEVGEKAYIAVALVRDPKGGKFLSRLIVSLDDLVCGSSPVTTSTVSTAQASRPRPPLSGVQRRY